jgi:hypothetical protein
MVIIAIGAIQLIATFVPQVSTYFTRPPLKFIAWIVSVGAVLFAIIN